MKNLFVLMLFAFLPLSGNAQIINIPGANFKYALISSICTDTDGDGILDSDIDTDNDGEIQLSEALATTNLTLIGLWGNTTGINSFANLETLNCTRGTLSSLSLSGLHNLKTLDCSDNSLYNLTLTGLDQLETLNCSDNDILTLLNLSGLDQLKTLNCYGTRLTTLNLTNLPALETVICFRAGLTSIVVSPTNTILDLNCGNNPNLALDLSSFPQLKSLTCVGMMLTTIDLSSLTQLENLNCAANNLTVVDISNQPLLKNLDCSRNALTALDFSNSPDIERLICNFNNISVLDCSSLSSLKTLDCSENGMTNLDAIFGNLVDLNCSKNDLILLPIPNSNALKYLNCMTNHLSELNIASATNLEILDCSKNEIAVLETGNLNNLKYLICSTNHIQNLEVANATGLETLKCSTNELTALNIAPLVNLETLSCSMNQISSLDFSNKTKLMVVEIDHNLFSILDLSQVGGGISRHYRYRLNNNPNLTYLNIKNGGRILHTSHQDPSGLWVDECPNLVNVCADEFNLGRFNSPNINATSYCTFNPGGTFNTILGTFSMDYDNNGCDDNDYRFSNGKINIESASSTGATFSDSNGNYTFFTQTGDFTIAPEFEHPYFTVTPESAVISFADLNGPTQIQNFCVSANGIHKDVEITLIPTSVSRPGFDNHYNLAFKNKGNQILSGNITLTFDDAVMDLTYASPETTSQSLNTITWNYDTLMPFENREIYFSMNLNSPQETPPLNNGDLLNLTATINPVSGDETPNDNAFTLSQTVINSLDPNDKTCLEGANVAPEKIGEYLHYVIRFQNSGTAAAENIVVKDVIDTEQFDMNSLQLVGSSHPHITRISGNIVEFLFAGIHLPTEQDDEPGSHGFVAFKIKTKNNLTIGSSVSNKADIYFDYNFPIATEPAVSTFNTLGTNAFHDPSVSLFPNPVKNQLTISAKDNIKSVQLYDVMGRMIETNSHNSNNVQMDLSRQASGIYFVKITTAKGNKIEKIIKQ